MAEAKAKIIVVGPVKAGKTRLANHIATSHIAELESRSAARANAEPVHKPSLDAYLPTAGVRILEFDREITHSTGKRGGARAAQLSVELWDCSGDQQYQHCWPAILSGAIGVILVYNPETANHDREIAKWYSSFIKSLSLAPSQILVMAHHPKAESYSPAAPPKGLTDFKLVDTTFNSERGEREISAAMVDFLNKVGAVALAQHESELDNL